jgi:hypothetical protein
VNATNRATAPNFPWASNDSDCLQSSRSENWPSSLLLDDYPSPVKRIFIKNPHRKSNLPCAMLITIRLAFLCLRPSQFFLFCFANRSERIFSNWFVGNSSCHVDDAIRPRVKPDADDPAAPVSYDGTTRGQGSHLNARVYQSPTKTPRNPRLARIFRNFFAEPPLHNIADFRLQISICRKSAICNVQFPLDAVVTGTIVRHPCNRSNDLC